MNRRGYAEILPEYDPFDARSKGGRDRSIFAPTTLRLYYGSLMITRSRMTAEVKSSGHPAGGVVERAYQRYRAEAIVRQAPGAIGVRNEIAVRPAQEFSQPSVPA